MTSHPEAEPRKPVGKEQRRWPRAATSLTITIALDGRKHSAKLRDLSRAGVCFYLDRRIPLMTVLELSLDLPTGGSTHKIRGSGAVVRCERISAGVEHYEVAVFLHDMADSDRALLDEHVRAALSVG